MSITKSIVDFALLGAEWVMWALVLCSVLSIAIMIERIFYFKRNKGNVADLKKNIDQAFSSGDQPKLNSGSIPSRVAASGLQNLSLGPKAVDEAMQGELQAAKIDFSKRLVILGTLGNNAPFIGLFGTVLGIISAFHRLKANPTGGIDLVMGAVAEALAATAVGIAVAIPAVIAYNLLGRWVRTEISKAETVSHTILSQVHGKDKS